EPHHTPSPEADTSHSTTSSIPLPSIPTDPIPSVTQPDITPIRQYSRRVRIAQSSALPTIADEPASLVRDAQKEEIVRLKDMVQVLEDREGGAAKHSGDDSPIKGRSINEWEAANERINNDSEDGKEVMVESDAPKKQRLQEQIDAQVARELEEQQEKENIRMNEQIARDAEVARIHAEEEIQGMIDSLDKSNETIAKNNLGWKVKDFKGLSFEEIEDKFTEVRKQVEDFIPIGSKEEAKRLKRKGTYGMATDYCIIKENVHTKRTEIRTCNNSREKGKMERKTTQSSRELH
nr:hypothetical protein [Tanacetum cinerariifolium]